MSRPFTDFSPKGVEGGFSPEQVTGLVESRIASKRPVRDVRTCKEVMSKVLVRKKLRLVHPEKSAAPLGRMSQAEPRLF